jgi:hypothetical protein
MKTLRSINMTLTMKTTGARFLKARSSQLTKDGVSIPAGLHNRKETGPGQKY